MKVIYPLLVFLFIISSGYCGRLLVEGRQSSDINYQLVQSIVPFQGIETLEVSFVSPSNFTSPTFQQQIKNLEFTFKPAPSNKSSRKDEWGNLVQTFVWENPSATIQSVVKVNFTNTVQLREIKDNSPFPPRITTTIPPEYLQASELVQSKHPEIKKLAAQLSGDKKTQLEVVRSVLAYIVDHVHYVLIPERYDALYSLQNGKGNCQNFSHLAAALLRAVNIPVRIVNGITLKKAYNIDAGQSEYRFDMAQGRHSWVEVYFPESGWVPFDPQQTEFFISNRYLRIEVGPDNAATISDGLVRWSSLAGAEPRQPELEEAVEANFVRDVVTLSGKKQLSGPEALLISPPVFAASTPLEPPKPPVVEEEKPQPEPQPEIAPEPLDYSKLQYNRPFTFGNSEFPRNFDFLKARLLGSENADARELKRNFIVETAEYVTGPNQFAQAFVLEKPVLLQDIQLAMHLFGGSGEVWLALSEDENGMPGSPAAFSRRVPTRAFPRNRGYDWVTFDFSREGLLLTPGRYWFQLQYEGSPIVNWFYSYGKPVGPVDGTRRKGAQGWREILNFEFNFQVRGKTADLPE